MRTLLLSATTLLIISASVTSASAATTTIEWDWSRDAKSAPALLTKGLNAKLEARQANPGLPIDGATLSRLGSGIDLREGANHIQCETMPAGGPGSDQYRCALTLDASAKKWSMFTGSFSAIVFDILWNISRDEGRRGRIVSLEAEGKTLICELNLSPLAVQETGCWLNIE